MDNPFLCSTRLALGQCIVLDESRLEKHEDSPSFLGRMVHERRRAGRGGGGVKTTAMQNAHRGTYCRALALWLYLRLRTKVLLSSCIDDGDKKRFRLSSATLIATIISIYLSI